MDAIRLARRYLKPAYRTYTKSKPTGEEKPVLLYWPAGIGPVPAGGRSVALGCELPPDVPIPEPIPKTLLDDRKSAR